MPPSSFSLDVNPAVLRWARESAGQSTAAVAERLKVSARTVEEWEAGRRVPEWRNLRRLAKEYQRPVGALLLAEPPSEPELPPDFRTLPKTRRELSSSTRLGIRTARWLQERAIELHEQLGRETEFSAERATLSQDPVKLAAKWRDELGISLEEQETWKSPHDAYNHWRRCLEAHGVLAFQFRFPVEELRGFSLYHPILPVICASESDLVQARVFTLFHEFAHLLLQQPGLCLPSETSPAICQDVETFCNRFSAAFLVPSSEVQSWQFTMRGLAAKEIDRTLQDFANRYRVSKYVILGRLRASGQLSQGGYDQITKRWQSKQKSRTLKPRKPQRGGPSAIAICNRQRGGAMISLVLEAADKGVITTHDAVTYLGVKTKDLQKIAAQRA